MLAAAAPAAAIVAILAAMLANAALAQEMRLPVLVPVTGFLALEGQSQRNGALLAVKQAPAGLKVAATVLDTGASPEIAVNALEKALGDKPSAIVASMLGTQLLAMLPIAAEAKTPLLTVSGTAKVTELGNPYIFRFFPADPIVKQAQARYVVETLGARNPAILYQTTAYGQSGLEHLHRNFVKLGAVPVYEEALDVSVKDFLPGLGKAKRAGADVLVLQLHAGPTALLVRQAAAMPLGLPIVAGSAMHQPATAELLQPEELRGICAETASSPISGGSPALERWTAAYRQEFGGPPDAYALGQYDGTMMALQAMAAGARTAQAVRDALGSTRHDGLAMTYKSDGAGNMAHSAMIVCYDGTSRIPRIAARYDNLDGALQ